MFHVSALASLALVAHVVLVNSCVTPAANKTASQIAEENKPPIISPSMPLEDALQAGVNFGGDTARSVRKLVTKRKQWPMAEKILYQAIQDGVIKYEDARLINAVLLYISGPVTPQESLFKQMVSSGRPLARQLAWQMAAALPGKVMRTAIEHEMNRAVFDDEEDEMFIPAMAGAVQANRMTSAYSVVRQGLLRTNHEAFAQAMSILNPEHASGDFLNYLALCPPEELRQLSVSSINIFAATVALNHMMKYPPNVNHSQIDYLFYYSISRNPGLSDIATGLVDMLAQKNQQAMALTLARMPVWSQVAFIEGARRNMSETKRVFLGELKKMSAQSEVIEELGDIHL